MYNKICVRHTHAFPLPSHARLTARQQLGGRGRERGRPRRRGRPHNARSENVSCPRSTLWDSAGCSHSSIERVAPGPRTDPGCHHPSWEEGRWYVGLRERKGREPKDQLGRSADLTAQDSKALPSSCCRQRTGQCLDAEADGGPGRAEAARLGVQIARAGQTAAERVLVIADASRQKVRSNFQELALLQPLAAHNPPP